MSHVSANEHIFGAIDASIQQFSQARPVLNPLLDLFQELFEQRAHLAQTFTSMPIQLPSIEPSRFAEGTPLLAGVSLDFLADWVDICAQTMLPLLEKTFPACDEFTTLHKALLDGSMHPAFVCQAFFDQNTHKLQAAADKCGVSASVLQYGAETVLSPVLYGLALQSQQHMQGLNWSQGSCPVCGSFPSIAYLAKPNPKQLESLVGGGGQKFLHCSCCSTNWRFRRDACPACTNNDPGTRKILHEEKHQQERVEACTKCKSYFLCVDLREYENAPDMDVAPLGLMHLDRIARQEGFAPLALSLWNAIQEPDACHD